jgi:hypothetical protein
VTAPTIEARPVVRGEAPSGRVTARINARRIEMALPVVLELVDAVRCFDRPRVEYLSQIVDQPAALILLAGMVPQDRSPKRLLAWSDNPPKVTRRRRPKPQALDIPAEVRELHATFTRLRTAKADVPADVRGGEREYQRQRAVKRRARAKENQT